MLGDGMVGLHEDTLSGFKARSAESLTAVGRELRMGPCEWDSPLFVPSQAQSLFPRCSAARACFGELFQFTRTMQDSSDGSLKDDGHEPRTCALQSRRGFVYVCQ